MDWKLPACLIPDPDEFPAFDLFMEAYNDLLGRAVERMAPKFGLQWQDVVEEEEKPKEEEKAKKPGKKTGSSKGAKVREGRNEGDRSMSNLISALLLTTISS